MARDPPLNGRLGHRDASTSADASALLSSASQLCKLVANVEKMCVSLETSNSLLLVKPMKPMSVLYSATVSVTFNSLLTLSLYLALLLVAMWL